MSEWFCNDEWVCWFCEKPFTYDGEKYQDVFCPHCQVMNSIYGPDETEHPLEEE